MKISNTIHGLSFPNEKEYDIEVHVKEGMPFYTNDKKYLIRMEGKMILSLDRSEVKKLVTSLNKFLASSKG